MPMVKEEHENLLREIAESGGDTAKMLELMQNLRDDFDEREGELKRYDEKRDKERPEGEAKEDDKIRQESKEADREDKRERRDPLSKDTVSRNEYDELKRKYIERFFSTPDEAKKSQEEDVKRDGKKQSFEELFEKKEG